MVIHQKLRNLKVYLSDAELQTLQIASSMSLFETQGDFIAASILDSADKEMEAWRYTTTTQNPNALEA